MIKRNLICSMLGHVDHGKSSLLDAIRGTKITEQEAGGITQTIGASMIPMKHIKELVGQLMKNEVDIPGLLFIDTPGHEAFTNLRKRGGNLSDIAVLVVDINEGIKPQTKEALEILKSHKTPFVIAANKIDRIAGWFSEGKALLTTINNQSQQVQTHLDTQLYKLVGDIYEKEQIQAERFDRIDDYAKKIAIVPVSAITKDGIPELLMILLGLCQKYLQEQMNVNIENNAKGTVLEVKEVKGQGKVVDAILYDGHLKKGDNVIIGGIHEPIATKVRNLFVPQELVETRYTSSTFNQVDRVDAACAVRIFAQQLGDAIGGMPLRSCSQSDVEKYKEEIQQEVEEVMIDTEERGVIVKADTLGSLEAMTHLLQQAEIPIQRATIGEIKKIDITAAASNKAEDPMTGVILAFNIPVSDEMLTSVKENGVSIIQSNIIYAILDQYKEWKKETERAIEAKSLDVLIPPCKIKVLKGYVFRQSNPAIVGMEVLAGKAKVNMPLMKTDGNTVTRIKGIQKDQKSVPFAIKGEQVAISLPGVAIGRRVQEDETLYSAINEEEFRIYKAHKQFLSEDDKTVLQEIAELQRNHYPGWGL